MKQRTPGFRSFWRSRRLHRRNALNNTARRAFRARDPGVDKVNLGRAGIHEAYLDAAADQRRTRLSAPFISARSFLEQFLANSTLPHAIG